MFSHAFSLFGLLAFSSAGLLEVTPNTPSRLYLPASTTQGQTNTLIRTSQPAQITTIHVPAVVTTSQQIPIGSTVSQQIPVTRSTATETYTVNTDNVQPAQIHAVNIPTVINQQVPVTRTATGTQQVTVNTETRTAKPAQIHTLNVPVGVSQQVPVGISQQFPTTTQTQQVSSAFHTNTLFRASQPAQINAYVSPSIASTTSQQVPIRQIAIVRLANENVGDGTYSFNYETENGISAEEHGQSDVAGAETVERVHGSYSYTGPDNVRYTITYVADENGYRAEGAHLPVPPTPIVHTPQVSTGASHVTRNFVNARSTVSGVHVIPTTVISQPLQIVQTPGVQTQRQANTVYTTYQQHVPVVQSQQNTFRHATVVPSSIVSGYQGIGYSQQIGRSSVQNQQGQSTAVPSSTVTLQQGSTGFTSQHTTADSVQSQVLQHQNTVVPNTVTVQQGDAQHTDAASAHVQDQHVLQSQSSVVPSSTVNVQQSATGYSTQTDVSSVQFQQGDLQRQASLVPINPATVQQQTVQNHGKEVHNQNTVVPSTVSVQQDISLNTQQSQLGVVQSTVVPSDTVTVYEGTTNQQTGFTGAIQQGVVQSLNTLVPSNTARIQPGTGFTSQTVSGTVQHGLQRQAVVPGGIVTIHQGKTGVINQRNNQQIQTLQGTQSQASGLSSSHVTVQLGSTGYATEQVGDTSSVQILEGNLLQNSVPANNIDAQQVTQQTGVSAVQSQQVVQGQAVIPSNNVTEQQTTNQETSVSQQGVTLPDGTVHYGY